MPAVTQIIDQARELADQGALPEAADLLQQQLGAHSGRSRAQMHFALGEILSLPDSEFQPRSLARLQVANDEIISGLALTAQLEREAALVRELIDDRNEALVTYGSNVAILSTRVSDEYAERSLTAARGILERAIQEERAASCRPEILYGAERELARTYKTTPNDPQYREHLIRAVHEAKQLMMDPLDLWEVHYELGLLALNEKDYDVAHHHLNEAFEAGCSVPEVPEGTLREIHFNLGTLAIFVGHFDQAQGIWDWELKQAIKEKNSSNIYRAAVGLMCADAGLGRLERLGELRSIARSESRVVTQKTAAFTLTLATLAISMATDRGDHQAATNLEKVLERLV